MGGGIGGIMKKITLYVDESDLRDFDDKIPTGLSRSNVLRALISNYRAMRDFHNVAGIIVGKPSEGEHDFIVQIMQPYFLKDKDNNVIRVTSGLVKISEAELIRHNLSLGDSVKFGEYNWKEVK